MNLKQLEAFVYVADTGSFSEAAKALYLTQPTVSAHVAGLEKEMNTLLLVRNTREVRLSEKGKTLYAYARKILELEKSIRQMFHLEEKNETNELRIAASTIPGQYVLPRLLAGFFKENPQVRFTVKEGDSEAVMKSVAEGISEIGFAGTDPAPGYRCKAIPFYEDELVLLTPPEKAFRACSRAGAFRETLCREPVLLREKGSGTRKEMEKYLKSQHIELSRMHIAAGMENQEAIKKAVAAGMGITVMSLAAAQDVVEKGEAYAFSFPGKRLIRKLQILYSESFSLSPCARKLVDYIQQQVAQDNGAEGV